MRVITTALETMDLISRSREKGKTVTFVPTMGALHEGHLALFREAQKRGDLVVVSIFVNPTQFDDKQDYEKYPRHLAADLKACEKVGVDVVFAPSELEIYPTDDRSPPMSVPAVARALEGASRPGHFDGVVSVVSRLFRIVNPEIAIFGQKDYQQLRVIQEMVHEQGMTIEIVGHPIVRTKEGLAMSSRNERLSPEGRRKALALFRGLQSCEELFLQKEREPARLTASVRQVLEGEKEIEIDYVTLVDAQSLEEISKITKSCVVLIAAFVEGVRLIDNCLLKSFRVKK